MAKNTITAKNEVLNAKIEEYKKLKRQADELDKQIKALNTEFKTMMHEADTQEIATDMFKLTLSVYEQDKFDTKAFKEAHPKMYKKFTTQTTIEKLLVK